MICLLLLLLLSKNSKNIHIIMKHYIKLLLSCFLTVLSVPAFSYTGALEFIVREDVNTKLHIIDYYNVIVVLRVHQTPFSSKQVQCGIFPLDYKTRIAKFGDNVVNFSSKEYALLNNKQYYYTDDKIHVSLYRKQCNDFIIKK